MMRSQIGRKGEEIAGQYLIEHGYTVVDKNYRTRLGEIDIIATSPKKGDEFAPHYVFVEVKTRTGRNFGYPEESVTREKLEHIIAVSQEYLLSKELINNEWQIDIISIEFGNPSQKPKIRHIENVTASMAWDDQRG